MNKKFSIVAALSLSLLAVSACKKDKKEDSDKGDTPAAKVSDTKGGETPTEVKPEIGKTAVAAAAKGDLWNHMPVETEIVVAIDMGNLTGSGLWKQYGPMIAAAAGEKLSVVKEKCGFDVMTTLQGIHMGFNSDNDKEPVIIVRGIERSVASKCIVAMAENEGEKVAVSQDGALTIVKAEKEEDSQMIAWVDDKTAIMVPKKMDKDYLAARIAGTDGLSGNKDLMAIVGKAKRDAPIWFAGKFKDGSKAAEGIKGMAEGKAIAGVFGGIGFEKGIEIALGAEFVNEADVAGAKAKIDQLLPMGKMMAGPAAPLLDKIKIAAAGKDLTINIDLSEADLATLTQLAGPMLGGMMGK